MPEIPAELSSLKSAFNIDATDNYESSSDDTLMIALIFSGSVVLGVAITVIVFFIMRRSRKTKSSEHEPKVVPDDSNVTRTKIEPLDQPPATTNATVPTSQDLTTDMIALEASNLPNQPTPNHNQPLTDMEDIINEDFQNEPIAPTVKSPEDKQLDVFKAQPPGVMSYKIQEPKINSSMQDPTNVRKRKKKKHQNKTETPTLRHN